MHLLDFERSVMLTWTLVILIGAVVGAAVCLLAFTLAMMQTGWFVIVWLMVCGIVAAVPVAMRLVRPRWPDSRVASRYGPATVAHPDPANDNRWRRPDDVRDGPPDDERATVC